MRALALTALLLAACSTAAAPAAAPARIVTSATGGLSLEVQELT